MNSTHQESIQSLLEWALSQYYDNRIYIIFLFVFLENFPMIGILFPAISLLVFAGYFSSNLVELFQAFLAGFLGIVFADNIWYTVGRLTKSKWKWLSRRIGREPGLRRVVLEQNIIVLLFYPFPPYFRMFLPAAFGVLEAPLRLWVPINLIASALFVGSFLGLGFTVKSYLGTEVTGAMNAATIVSVAITILFIPYLVLLYRRWKQKRQLRISRDE